MNKSKLKPISLALVLAGVAPAMLVSPVSASNIQEKITVTQGKSISPHEEEIISSAGTKVLRHIAQARADIHNNKAKEASGQLAKAQKLLDIIQESLPTTKVKDRIWVAKKHLEYEDTQSVLPDLVPISSSLDELIDVMPVKVARQHLEQAKTHLKSGNKQKAKEALEATDAALEYTEIDLPLSTTRNLVDQAVTDLAKGRNDAAAKALESAENSVVYLSFAIEQPLFSAKAFLWQTVLDLEAGHKDLAKSDLQAAVTNLNAASKSEHKPTAQAAKDMLTIAKQLQGELNNDVDVTAKVQHLWERAKAYTDRSMEYLVAGWERYRSDKPFKSELIEARLHLTNARIDLFTGHEPDQAKKELAKSMEYLKQAASKSKQDKAYKTYVGQIDKIESSLKSLKADRNKDKPSSYLTVENQLSSVIRAL